MDAQFIECDIEKAKSNARHGVFAEAYSVNSAEWLPIRFEFNDSPFGSYAEWYVVEDDRYVAINDYTKFRINGPVPKE